MVCSRHVTVNILYEANNKYSYLRTPCSRGVLEKLAGSQLVKKFPAFYGTRRFVTAFTSGRHLSLSWARSIQSMTPHSTSWRSILIQGYYKRNRLFQRYVVSKPLAYWTHNLRSSVEDRVFVPPIPVSLKELKQRITTAVASVDEDMLRSVWTEFDIILISVVWQMLTHRTFVT